MKKLTFLFLSMLWFSNYAKSVNAIVIDSTVVIDNNIIYKVVQDPHNFFVTVETDDRKASKTILREGVTVFFDIKGKKKKNVFVRYPNKSPKPTGRRQQRGEENMEEKEELNRENSIDDLPQEAFYNYFNSQREFHILLNDLNINVSFDVLGHNRIKYTLKIPKHKINDNPKKDLSKLTIGVLIGRDRTDEANNEQRPGGGQSGMRMGGGSQGGGRSGGGMSGIGGGRQGGGMSGGGGRQSGGNGGGQRPSQENRTQPSPFWFEVNSIQ